MHEGLLALRLIVGLLMAAHGTQKLFGWLGGYGIAGTGQFFERLGFRPGRLFAAAAGTSELLGGLLIAAGFLGPLGPVMVLATMIVAIAAVHWPGGLFATTNGVELPLIYAAVAIAIMFTGPGAYSVDAVLGLTGFWTLGVALAALVAGIAGAIVNLGLRHSAAVEA
jgi:putative oxidoreductase